EGATFEPTILMVGGDGNADFEAAGVVVTARVLKHDLGPKIRIGKYKKRTGYKRHNGHRSRLTQIQIESIGAARRATRASSKKTEQAEPAAPAEPQEATE